MIGRFRAVEDRYIETFSQRIERGDHVVFRDERLPDMYAFNCTLIRDCLQGPRLADSVGLRLAEARREGQDFLQLILHPGIEVPEGLKDHFRSLGFEAQTYLYMRLGGCELSSLRGNDDCSVIRATAENELADGQQLDVETSVGVGMPAEFAVRKAGRKREVFRDASRQLFSYLCYHRGQAIGKCELFMSGEYAKLEDFDVLERYRRQGFGTAMLKKMISDARGLGARQIYLLTDKADTPQEMYRKLGFEILGEETQLFWRSR